MDNNHIIIAHSHRQFLEGIVSEVLKNQYNIAKQFTSGVKALRYILRDKPEIAIIQSQFSDISAFEIINEARAKDIDIKFVIIFPKSEYKQFLIASKKNIAGCIYAGEVLEDLLDCLNTVLQGEVFVSRGIQSTKPKDASVDLISTLSATEMKVLTLVSIYRKSSKISNKLDISIRTIEKHRSNIIKKLKINSKVNSLPNWADEHKDLIQTFALQSLS